MNMMIQLVYTFIYNEEGKVKVNLYLCLTRYHALRTHFVLN
jgi:hypothetical protein